VVLLPKADPGSGERGDTQSFTFKIHGQFERFFSKFQFMVNFKDFLQIRGCFLLYLPLQAAQIPKTSNEGDFT
jgi:hypothetical protein